MAATAANRPPSAHPGPGGGNLLHPRVHSSGATSQQLDPGPHGTGPDPGPPSHPQHPVNARPVFYVHAPPPPPFFHYQWPMPFSYNPFTGFPGMGYGMVMPPFPPPPPYLEAPAYILPHPHIQPVDYRRLLHPQVHAPSASYQNPNQTRRVRLPHTGPVRETVNTEVQTEPTQRGVGRYNEESPLISSDSGRGTASNSPSPSRSTSQRRGSAEVDSYTLPSSNAIDTQGKTGASSVKHGFNAPHPTETKAVQSLIGETPETQKDIKDSVVQKTLCRNSHCNMWSVGSAESIVPVCSSSQQEEEVVKERRISVPDILMSWAGGTPQPVTLQIAEKLPQTDCQLPYCRNEAEQEKFVFQSPTESKKGPVVAEGHLSLKDAETLFKILKLKEPQAEQKADSGGEPLGLASSVSQCLSYRDELRQSLNASHTLPDKEQESETNPLEDTTDIVPSQVSLNSFQMKRRMNESVWSVESLAPFIPTAEWLLQNSVFEHQVIVELAGEVGDCPPLTQKDNPVVDAGKERGRTGRCSSSDSVLISDSCPVFSTPAGKPSAPTTPEMQREPDASEMRRVKRGKSTAPPQDPCASPTHLLQNRTVLSSHTEEDVDRNGSSEPEANQSPNQECVIVNEQQEKKPCSPEQGETLLLNSVTGEKTSSADEPMAQKVVDVEDGACRNKEVCQLRNEQLCVPVADQKMIQVSPSKGHLVDCGVQCSQLHEQKCVTCEEMNSMGPNKKLLFKHPDVKKANNADGGCMKGPNQKNQKKHHWRNREKFSQQDAYNGFCGKPGKPPGVNGRNRY